MTWEEIRIQYRDRWVIVEAINAFTDTFGKRIIKDLLLIDICNDGASAFSKYRQLHKENKNREYYYLHTSRVTIEISEDTWIGVRLPNAT